MFINVERKWQKEIYQRYWQAEIKLKTAKIRNKCKSAAAAKLR